jgi:calcium-dependent protein kinase
MGCAQTSQILESSQTKEPSSPKQRRRLGAFNFRDLVKNDVDKKLQEAKEGQNYTMEEKLHRINGFVQRRIVHDYPYTDDYTVGKVVGSGVSGDVYHATMKSNAKWMGVQKDVVLKTLTKKNISDQKLDELLAETEVGLILDHPLICRILRVYETDTEVTLVLEYCSGGDMFDRLVALGHYPEPMAQTTCVQMLTALKYLQSQHVVHRDIKLENWLYANNDESSPLCLTDFGYAKYYDSSVDELLTNMVGSSYYMAPEVLRRSYGHECDMWSTGVVAYMLMCGHPPFEGEDANKIFENVLTQELSFERPAFATVSEDARNFLRHVLTRDVSLRPGPSQALEHPWLANLDKAARLPMELRDTSVDSLLKFAYQPHLRRAALVLMGGGASSQMFRDARGAFLDLDLTGSGTIALRSFEQHLLDRDPDIDKFLIRNTFSKLDVHKNGEIHYSEFLGAYDQFALSESDDAIRRAFSMFDSDASGFITKENLREVFKGRLSKEKELLGFERMLQEAGCSDSRGMSLTDFAKMVKNPRPEDEMSPKLSRMLSDRRNTRDERLDDAGLAAASQISVPSAQNQPADGLATPSVSRTPTLHHDEISRMESVKSVNSQNPRSSVERTSTLLHDSIVRMESVKAVTASMSAVPGTPTILHDTISRMESAKSIKSATGQKTTASTPAVPRTKTISFTDSISRLASGQKTTSSNDRISI